MFSVSSLCRGLSHAAFAGVAAHVTPWATRSIAVSLLGKSAGALATLPFTGFVTPLTMAASGQVGKKVYDYAHGRIAYERTLWDYKNLKPCKVTFQENVDEDWTNVKVRKNKHAAASQPGSWWYS